MVSQYNLYAAEATSDGSEEEVYNLVESYDGIAMEFTLDNSIETSFISGTKYRFRLSATNSIGEGEMSNSVTVAMADAAPQPAAPTLVLEKSTKTSLYIEWLAVAPTDSLVIDGY